MKLTGNQAKISQPTLSPLERLERLGRQRLLELRQKGQARVPAPLRSDGGLALAAQHGRGTHCGPLAVQQQSVGLCPQRPSSQAHHVQMPEPTTLTAFPSRGSAYHSAGICQPCPYFHKGLCRKGAECKLCHLCCPEVKRYAHEKQKAYAAAHTGSLLGDHPSPTASTVPSSGRSSPGGAASQVFVLSTAPTSPTALRGPPSSTESNFGWLASTPAPTPKSAPPCSPPKLGTCLALDGRQPLPVLSFPPPRAPHLTIFREELPPPPAHAPSCAAVELPLQDEISPPSAGSSVINSDLPISATHSSSCSLGGDLAQTKHASPLRPLPCSVTQALPCGAALLTLPPSPQAQKDPTGASSLRESTVVLVRNGCGMLDVFEVSEAKGPDCQDDEEDELLPAHFQSSRRSRSCPPAFHHLVKRRDSDRDCCKEEVQYQEEVDEPMFSTMEDFTSCDEGSEVWWETEEGLASEATTHSSSVEGPESLPKRRDKANKKQKNGKAVSGPTLLRGGVPKQAVPHDM